MVRDVVTCNREGRIVQLKLFAAGLIDYATRKPPKPAKPQYASQVRQLSDSLHYQLEHHGVNTTNSLKGFIIGQLPTSHPPHSHHEQHPNSQRLEVVSPVKRHHIKPLRWSML